jgi:hypothetical protein
VQQRQVQRRGAVLVALVQVNLRLLLLLISLLRE